MTDETDIQPGADGGEPIDVLAAQNDRQTEAERINSEGRKARRHVLADCVASILNAGVALDSIAQNLFLVSAILKKAKAQGGMRAALLDDVIAELDIIVTDMPREGSGHSQGADALSGRVN